MVVESLKSHMPKPVPFPGPYPDPAGVNLPEPLADRTYCGDLDIFINPKGSWHYNGKRITQKGLVCLFASILKRSGDGVYWLVSPTEMGRIEVADAPFVAIECYVGKSGKSQTISLRTNADQIFTLGDTATLIERPNPATRKPRTYAIVENGIEVRLNQQVCDHLVELSEEIRRDDKTIRGVYSEGMFFSLQHMV